MGVGAWLALKARELCREEGKVGFILRDEAIKAREKEESVCALTCPPRVMARMPCVEVLRAELHLIVLRPVCDVI